MREKINKNKVVKNRDSSPPISLCFYRPPRNIFQWKSAKLTRNKILPLTQCTFLYAFQSNSRTVYANAIGVKCKRKRILKVKICVLKKLSKNLFSSSPTSFHFSLRFICRQVDQPVQSVQLTFCCDN